MWFGCLIDESVFKVGNVWISDEVVFQKGDAGNHDGEFPAAFEDSLTVNFGNKDGKEVVYVETWAVFEGFDSH